MCISFGAEKFAVRFGISICRHIVCVVYCWWGWHWAKINVLEA